MNVNKNICFKLGLFPNISMSVLTRESNKKLVQVNRTVSSDSKVLTTTYEIVGQQLIMVSFKNVSFK